MNRFIRTTIAALPLSIALLGTGCAAEAGEEPDEEVATAEAELGARCTHHHQCPNSRCMPHPDGYRCGPAPVPAPVAPGTPKRPVRGCPGGTDGECGWGYRCMAGSPNYCVAKSVGEVVGDVPVCQTLCETAATGAATAKCPKVGDPRKAIACWLAWEAGKLLVCGTFCD